MPFDKTTASERTSHQRYENMVRGKHKPCTSLEHSSGRYLMITFLLRYRRKPYRGAVSSYCAMALRTSTIPPFPLPRSSTSSRLAYLSRNLFHRHDKISVSLKNEYNG